MNLLSILMGIGMMVGTSFSLPKIVWTDCPTESYEVFHAFKKILKDKKYNCYGNPSSPYEQRVCPRKNCEGMYFKQTFCYAGNEFSLYFTDKRCTCNCSTNFHGSDLDILDIAPCSCDDDEVIAKRDW